MAAPDRYLQLRRLTEVSRQLTAAVSLADVLTLTVARAAELLDAERSVLLLADDDGLLSVRASHGLDAATWEAFRAPLQETLSTRLHELLGVDDPAGFLGVPLVAGGEVTGLLAVARRAAAGEVLDEQEWLLSALADQAAVALEKTRLGQNEEFRERLIGIVSHDLRGPIASILMGAELLEGDEQLDAQAARVVARIRSSAERASRMISDLLDYTQARLGGGIRVEPRAADLHAVVQLAVDEVQGLHPHRRIGVELVGDGRGEWDPDRLGQVVGNLLSNAVHYSPADLPVEVSVRGADPAVTICIHNGGPAISPARLPHVFEPMQRATAQLGASHRSVGLGLYIVQQLVAAHQGELALTSTEAEGTTVTVTLPRHARAAPR